MQGKRKKLLGRPKGTSKVTKDKYHYAKYLNNNMGVPIIEACIRTKISKTSFYRLENFIFQQDFKNEKDGENRELLLNIDGLWKGPKKYYAYMDNDRPIL